jgi:hypothetical protein
MAQMDERLGRLLGESLSPLFDRVAALERGGAARAPGRGAAAGGSLFDDLETDETGADAGALGRDGMEGPRRGRTVRALDELLAEVGGTAAEGGTLAGRAQVGTRHEGQGPAGRRGEPAFKPMREPMPPPGEGEESQVGSPGVSRVEGALLRVLSKLAGRRESADDEAEEGPGQGPAAGTRGIDRLDRLYRAFNDTPYRYYEGFKESVNHVMTGKKTVMVDPSEAFKLETFFEKHGGLGTAARPEGKDSWRPLAQVVTRIGCEQLRALEGGEWARAAALTAALLVAMEALGKSDGKLAYSQGFVPLTFVGEGAWAPRLDGPPVPGSVPATWTAAVAGSTSDLSKLTEAVRKMKV